jgi:hypothetical protein
MNRSAIIAALVALVALATQGCIKDADQYDYPLSAAVTMPTPSEAVSYVNETFDDISKVDGLMFTPPEGWSVIAAVGTRCFQTGVVAKKGGGTMRGVTATGYLSADPINDIWLILPPLDVSDATATLSFEAGITYGNTNTKLSVFYSDSTYSGGSPNIDLRQWHELPNITIGETSRGPVEMFAKSDISLYGLGGSREVVYVAFRYRAQVSLAEIALNGGSRANCYIDNVKFRRQ